MKTLLLLVLGSISFNVYANCPAGMATVDQYGNCYMHDGRGGVTGYSTGMASPPSQKSKPKVIYIKKPDSWGALSVAKSSGKGEPNRLYSSLEHESKTVAKNAAVRDCKAKNNKFCKYLIVWSNGCAAVAEGRNAQGFFNLFPNSKETAEDAEKSVLNKCEKAGHTDCKIIVPAQCSLPK